MVDILRILAKLDLCICCSDVYCAGGSFEYSAVTTPKRHNQSPEILKFVAEINYENSKNQGVICKPYIKRCILIWGQEHMGSREKRIMFST